MIHVRGPKHTESKYAIPLRGPGAVYDVSFGGAGLRFAHTTAARLLSRTALRCALHEARTDSTDAFSAVARVNEKVSSLYASLAI
jgi:hypothetical protein